MASKILANAIARLKSPMCVLGELSSEKEKNEEKEVHAWRNYKLIYNS